MSKFPKPAEIRKALVALASLATALLAYGVLPEKVVPWVLAALTALGTLGVYAVQNKPPTRTVAAKPDEAGAVDVLTICVALLAFYGTCWFLFEFLNLGAGK